jgi:diguanylate cyclase (GGDEF)-like protein
MYASVDNFIRARDEIGDMDSKRLVDEIAGIIGSQCDPNDLMTRYGECTFAVLCSGVTTDNAKKTAELIRSTVGKAVFEAAGHTLLTSISIGICAVRGSDFDAEQVISRAKQACESVRLTGGNQVLVNSAVSDTLSVTGSNASPAEIVDRVLVENRIRIYYQPITRLKDNSINCFEVLTRVVDENNDIILPGDFLSMAVTSGKAREVDLHVIESSMRMLADNSNPNIKLFIKLTPQSVSYHDFPLWIMSKCKQYRINPGRLVFEVTERTLGSELENLSMLSRALDKIGCRIAIADYRLENQTQHLGHIHAEYLKIDSELVQNICGNGRFLAKVTGIMEVARNYNFTTIAESVENPQCLAVLRELGVNLAQGYFISGPAGNAIFESHDGDTGDAVANHSKASFALG